MCHKILMQHHKSDTNPQGVDVVLRIQRLTSSFPPAGPSCVRRRGRLSGHGSPQQERCSRVRTANPTGVAGEHPESVCVRA